MEPIFRNMTRAELDIAYNNVKAEPDFARLMARYQKSSRVFYEIFAVERDIAYGSASRQRFDWVSCGHPTAPTFVFIHGGYWQNYTKEDLAFVALGPIARGFNVVLAEYTLAPQASMTQIVGEIGSLLHHLAASDSAAGFGGRPVCMCGHSAGGQLAALHRSHAAVDVTVAVSGLFDLEPISLSWLNDKLKLTATEIAEYSPQRHIGRETPTIVSVGSAELPELVRHSTEYAEACRVNGEVATYLALEGRTHFAILKDIGTPNSAILEAVAKTIGSVEVRGRTPTERLAVDHAEMNEKEQS